MLSVLNFIPHRRSSKTCMWTVAFLKVENQYSTCTHKVVEDSVGRFEVCVIYNTNPQTQTCNTLIYFKTTFFFIINCHEKVDNKMDCVVCIMFGIANILGSTVFKFENIKVCYWTMSKICKEGGKNTTLPNETKGPSSYLKSKTHIQQTRPA